MQVREKSLLLKSVRSQFKSESSPIAVISSPSEVISSQEVSCLTQSHFAFRIKLKENCYLLDTSVMEKYLSQMSVFMKREVQL